MEGRTVSPGGKGERGGMEAAEFLVLHPAVPSTLIATARRRSIAGLCNHRSQTLCMPWFPAPPPASPPPRCPKHLNSNSGEAEAHREPFTITGARPFACPYS